MKDIDMLFFLLDKIYHHYAAMSGSVLVAGAMANAKVPRLGLFEQGHKGTWLFRDNLGDEILPSYVGIISVNH